LAIPEDIKKSPKFAQIEADKFKAISTLLLCELDVLQKAHLFNIRKLDSEIFMLADKLKYELMPKSFKML